MAQNQKLIVQTPRGQVISVQTKNGKVTARLTWNAGTGSKWTGNFTRAQKYLDSEVLRTTTPFVPLRSAALIKSGQLGTVIGSGLVAWIAPYAARQYWTTALSRAYDAQRGGKWFERSKAQNKAQWAAGVKKIAGGKT